MPPPINPLNQPPQDERNLRKLLTEGLGSGGEDVEIGNTLRRGGKRGPMGADATFRGKIRPDQPGLRYNLLLIADADRGGQPRFVNLDTLRWVKALQRMSRPWGDPQASHNTIPREERRYAKDATYTTSGGNTGVRHFYPPGYGPLDDEDAPESRQPKAPISELRGPAGRERFNKWLTEGGIGTRTRDFSEGENMEGLGVEFSAPGRGMLNDGGRWSRGRFMPTGAAERLAQSLGVQRIPMVPRQRFSAGASSMGVGAVNHFFPGQRRASQDFAVQPRPQPQLGALGNAQLVPIMLPQGQAPAVGVTPTGGYAPPPQNAALIPARRFALGEEEMGGGMPGLGMQQQFRVGDRPDYLNKPEVEGGRSVFPQRRSYGTSSTNYDPAGQADRLNTAQFPLGDRMKSRAIGQIAPIKPSYQPNEMAQKLDRASIPRDRYGNVARQQAGDERSWGDWWQGLNNGLEDWMRGPGMSAVKSGGRALLQGGVDAVGGLGYRQLGGGVRDARVGLGNVLGGNVAQGLGGIARGVGRVGLGLGQGVLSGLGGIAKSLYGDFVNRPRAGVNARRVGAARYSPSDKAFMRSTRQQYSLGEQDFSREDDFGDLLSQLGLGSDIPQVADEPLMVAPQTPEEIMRARATINTAHGPRDLYDMDPEKMSGYLRGQGLMTAGKPTQNRLRSVYGASGRIQPERAQQIVQGPHETGVAGRVADIIGELPHQQAPSESPEQRRRRVSGRELGSFGLGEQDFGLLDTIKHIGSMVNPVTNYRNLREGGHGRLASGAMVGGGLLGDAMLTGFHPPLVSLGVGRYAQGKAQAADRASDERRAEWMRG